MRKFCLIFFVFELKYWKRGKKQEQSVKILTTLSLLRNKGWSCEEKDYS